LGVLKGQKRVKKDSDSQNLLFFKKIMEGYFNLENLFDEGVNV
jgi:hypothetical protein